MRLSEFNNIGGISEPDELYTFDHLSNGYEYGNIHSIIETFSFRMYRIYRPLTKTGIGDLNILKNIAAHDAVMSFHLSKYIYKDDGNPRRLVGVMGGHAEKRSSVQYLEVASLCRLLSQKGFIIVTGGGPGLMEAAHLGAYYSKYDENVWKMILKTLKSISSEQTAIDSISKRELLDDSGALVKDWVVAAKEINEWFSFAVDLKNKFPPVEEAGEPKSIAISTWEYGREPVMPFADIYAAFFQNSIRESALVRESRSGIIYARGGGGTLREIGQDIEENYYTNSRSSFTPMIFFDFESYWGNISSNGTNDMDIYSTVLRLLGYRLESKSFSWEDKVISTINREKIVDILEKHYQEMHGWRQILVNIARSE